MSNATTPFPARAGDVAPLSADSARAAGPGPLVSVLLVVGAWFAVGLLSAAQYLLAAYTLGRPVEWVPQLQRELVPWQVWSLLTPLAFAIGRRFPLEPGRLLRSLPVHFIAGAFFSAAYLATYSVWVRYAMTGYRDGTFGEMFLAIFRARLNVTVIVYALLIGVEHAIRHFREMRAREIEAVRAQAESARALAEAAEARAGHARARLQALRSQLHPHFLFNTLHSIASLMDEDVPTSRRLIARLSDLLRATLEFGDDAEVTLGSEADFLERYLDIEQVRYGPRLRVRWEIPADLRPALVPPLLLQPLVENAIRHGIAPLEEGGEVTVRATRDGRHLELEVVDTGRGAGASPGSGNGLRITRERLAHTYGADHEFTIASNGRPGFSVRIRLPLRDLGEAPLATGGLP